MLRLAENGGKFTVECLDKCAVAVALYADLTAADALPQMFYD